MIRFCALLGFVLCAGCQSGTVTEETNQVYLKQAGRITSVRSAEKYVIFESRFSFKEGVDLQAVRAGEVVAQLRVSPLSRKPFYAADLISGNVMVNDLVEPAE